MQIRHEECLLFGSLAQKLQGQSSFSLVRKALRIPLSVFCLRPAPRIFTKILEVPISLIRRLNIRINIYLDDMLLLGRLINEVLIATDTAIFSLQHLGFVINLKKSILTPQQKIVFRCPGGFCQHVTVFDSRETDESDQPMFGDVQNRESVHFTIDKAHMSFKFNSTSSVTCTTSVSVFTTNSGRIA